MDDKSKILYTVLLLLLVSISVLAFTGSKVGFATTPNSCSDNDGGQNPQLFGTVTGYLRNKFYSNSDSCASTTAVKEFYCSGTSSTFKSMSCGTAYNSPNYCNSNKVYYDRVTPKCTTGVCTETRTPTLVQTCPSGYACTAGACVPPPTDSCSDTDGSDPSVLGSVSGYQFGSAYSYSDICVAPGHVLEYVCAGVTPNALNISCGIDSYSANYCNSNQVYRDFTDYSCTNGACAAATTPQFLETCTYQCSDGICQGQLDSCSDTDGGNVISAVGTTSGYSSNNQFSHTDYCADHGNVAEYYCSGVYEQSQTQSCGTDAYVGSNYCQGGDVYRTYRDFYCTNGACTSADTPTLQQDCTAGQTCSGGSCLSLDSCSDTDGGNVITIAGRVYGKQNGSSYNSSDYCSNPQYILEYYCYGNYKQSTYTNCGNDYNTSAFCVGSLRYRNSTDYYCSLAACKVNKASIYLDSCPYGCTGAGVCNSAPANSCSDTDGGYVPTVRGTITGYSSGYPYSNTDYCNGTTMLTEYYCSGTTKYSYPTWCATNMTTICSSGACI